MTGKGAVAIRVGTWKESERPVNLLLIEELLCSKGESSL